MAKRSRLRVHKDNRGRGVLLCIAFLGVFITLCYSLEKKYEIVLHLREFISRASTTLSKNSLDRGTIYDRNFKQLAVSMERVAVFVRTREVESISDTALSLAPVLFLDSNTLIDQLESGVLRFWIAEDISEEQEKELKRLNLPGVHFQKEEKRYYPNGSKAAHLIGYVEDGIGLSGVEFYYDRLLATRKLQQEKESKSISSAQDLVLTIDLKIQNILESLVATISEQAGGVRVASYLVESTTGEIIGGAQYPGFDPNKFARYTRKAVQNMFFEQFFLPDKFRLFLKDCADIYAQSEALETQLPWWLIADGTTMGKQLQLWENLNLGGGATADFYVIETAGESGSTVGNQERMKRVGPDFGFIPEVSTPMALLSAFSELLNGEFERPPMLVKKILDIETGHEVVLLAGSSETSTGEKVLDYNSELDRLFESQAVKKESGSLYFRDDIVISTPASNHYNQSFINDFTLVSIPSGERELNLLTIVQRYPVNPQNSGSRAVAVEDILDAKVQRISNLNQVAGIVADVVEPEEAVDANYQSEDSPEQQVGATKIQKDREPGLIATMPDLKGLSLRKSLRMLRGLSVDVKIEGTGRVIRQHPSPGTPFKKITSCTLILEKSEDMRLEKMSQKIMR
jgi:cell division protein FtsI (penicillin-binding protein 3)